MSQSRTFVFGIPISAVVFALAHAIWHSSVISSVFAGATFIGVASLVWYSPYPDSTHAFGRGQRRQQWGFTTKQDDDKWIQEPQYGWGDTDE